MQLHNIGNDLLSAIRSNVGRMAFVTSFGNLTYGQFDNLIGGIALDLKEAGVCRGSRVAIDTRDARIATASVIACCLLGASWLHGSRAAYQKPGLGITHVYWAGNRNEVPPGHPRLISFDSGRLKSRDMEFWLDKVDPEGYASDSDICRIGQSSGTTGSTKFIAITLRDMWERAMWKSSGMPADVLPVIACLFPPLSGVGCNTRLRTLLAGGCCVETGPGTLLEPWQAAGVNTVIGSPAQFSAFLREAGEGLADRIGAAMVGGGKPSERFLQSLFTCFKTVTVFYGSTEMGHAAETRITDQAGFDGGLTPIADMVYIEVVDDADQALPTGSEGRIRIRGTLGTPSYVNERLSVENTIRDGWFYPGDIGHFDTSGRLHVSGRGNEVLNIGGVKFNALVLDDVVQGYKGVKDGYCYLHDNQFGSAEIEVIFVPVAGQDVASIAQGLLADCARTLPANLAPKRAFAVTQLPRTDTGKAMRSKAQEVVATLQPAAIAS